MFFFVVYCCKDKKEEFAKLNAKRQECYQELAIMYILEVKHNDDSVYKTGIKHLACFLSLLSASKVNYFPVIKDSSIVFSIETFSSSLFLHAFDTHKKIKNKNLNLFKYTIESYQRCQELVSRINATWDLTVSKENQLKIMDKLINSIVEISIQSLINEEMDVNSCRNEFFSVLESDNNKGATFPARFLDKLFEILDKYPQKANNFYQLLKTKITIVNNSSNNSYNSNSSSISNNSSSSSSGTSSVIPSKTGLNCLIKLSSVTQFAKIISDDDDIWMNSSDISGMKTLIGSYLVISHEIDDQMCEKFDGIGELYDQDGITNPSLQKIFGEYNNHVYEYQNGTHQIVRNFLRVKSCRENVLKLFEHLLDLNVNRSDDNSECIKCLVARASRNHGASLSNSVLLAYGTDGFMLNLNYVMLELCSPIIDKDFKAKLDTKFFLTRNNKHSRLNFGKNNNLKHELKQDESKEQDKAAREFGFTSKIFCLTLESLHVGFIIAEKRASDFKQVIDNNKQLGGYGTKKMEDLWLGQIAHLMNKKCMIKTAEIYCYFCQWVMYLANENKQDMLAIIPNYIVQDLSSFFRFWNFVTDRSNETYENKTQNKNENKNKAFSKHSVIDCALYLMSNKSPMKSIYHRGCLLNALVAFLPVDVDRLIKDRKKGHLLFDGSLLFDRNKYCQHEYIVMPRCINDMVLLLLKLYYDIGNTGRDNQWDEKSHFRLLICHLLSFLFCYDEHKFQLIKLTQTKKSSDEYNILIKFIDIVLDDFIVTFDNAFLSFDSIENILSGKENQLQSKLIECENDASNNIHRANESLSLIKFLSSAVGNVLLNDDIIIEKVARLVNVYAKKIVEILTNVKYNSKYVLEHAKEYNYNPQLLLSYLMTIFVNLTSKTEQDKSKRKDKFLRAMIEDGTNFDVYIYSSVCKLIESEFDSVEMEELNVWLTKLANEAKKCANENMYANIDMISGDSFEIPNEYLDPITYTLMRDPVQIKSKKTGEMFTMDRKNVEKMMRNGGVNPFTHEKLTFDNLVEDKKLKNEINLWIDKNSEKAKEIVKIQQQEKEKDREKKKHQQEKQEKKEKEIREKTKKKKKKGSDARKQEMLLAASETSDADMDDDGDDSKQVEYNGMNRCPKCTLINAIGAARCRVCDYAFNGKQNTKCPHCTYSNDSEAKNCEMCRLPLNGNGNAIASPNAEFARLLELLRRADVNNNSNNNNGNVNSPPMSGGGGGARKNRLNEQAAAAGLLHKAYFEPIRNAILSNNFDQFSNKWKNLDFKPLLWKRILIEVLSTNVSNSTKMGKFMIDSDSIVERDLSFTIACYTNNFKLGKYLLQDKKAFPNQILEEKYGTSLFWASYHENVQLLKLIINSNRFDFVNLINSIEMQKGRSAFQVLSFNGNVTCLDLIIQACEKDEDCELDIMAVDYDGDSPLHLSLHTQNVEMVEYLCKNIYINCFDEIMAIKNYKQMTPMMLAKITIGSDQFPNAHKVMMILQNAQKQSDQLKKSQKTEKIEKKEDAIIYESKDDDDDKKYKTRGSKMFSTKTQQQSQKRFSRHSVQRSLTSVNNVSAAQTNSAFGSTFGSGFGSAFGTQIGSMVTNDVYNFSTSQGSSDIQRRYNKIEDGGFDKWKDLY